MGRLVRGDWSLVAAAVLLIVTGTVAKPTSDE
jgi:hypothetical protein